MKNIFIISIFLLFSTIALNAQTPGTLDASFGNNGIISTQVPVKSGDGVTISRQIRHSDGKFTALVLKYIIDDISGNYTADYYVYRFESNGQVDAAFGNSGGLALNFPVSRMFLQSDNKILLCGTMDDEIITMRLLSNGTLDKSYGYEGTNYTGLFIDLFSALLFQNDKLLISGPSPIDNQTMLVMLEPDGTRDFNFGTDGIRYYNYDMSKESNYFTIIKQMPDGKIVLGGTSYSYNNTVHAIFMRLNDKFEYDSSFSSDGLQKMNYEGFRLSDFEITGDSKIVAGGFYYYNNYNNMALVFSRLKANGIPDSSFGAKSTRTANFGGLRDNVQKLILQPDGKLVATGYSEGSFGLIRLTTSGNLDLAFNSTGKTITAFAGSGDGYPTYLHMEADGKLLVTGYVFYPDSMSRFTMARYHSGYNTSIGMLNTIQQLTLYPNPVNSVCHIEYTLEQPGQVTLALYDMQGKLMQHKAGDKMQTSGRHEVNLQMEDLPSGIYLLIMSQNGEQQTFKLLKE